jgi:FtsH ternary system domain X3-analog
MATMQIILRRDPTSGKQNIWVKLDSDPDALPIEHEQMHKKLVEKLVGKVLSPDDLGEIIIDREGQVEVIEPPKNTNEPEKQRTATGR